MDSTAPEPAFAPIFSALPACLLMRMSADSRAAIRRLSPAISERYLAEDFLRSAVSDLPDFLAIRAISALS